MIYKDHPTWKMLEEGKQETKAIMNEINILINKMPSYISEQYEAVYDKISANHRQLVMLQLEVESKLCQDLSKS